MTKKMAEPVYRLMTKEDIEKVRKLIKKVFDRYVAPTYNQEGIETFYDIISPESMLKRLAENHFAIVAEVNGNIVGVIQGKDNNHISLLFVAEQFQNRGIARSLLKQSIGLCVKNNPELLQITVCSSPNSVKIYEKLGFKQTDFEQSTKGLRCTPMMLELLDIHCKDR